MDFHPIEDGDFPPEINTTPLIDVLLVLLVMLIVTIPAPPRGLEVALPGHGSVPPTPPKPTMVRVTVNAAGGWRWNGDEVVDRADLDRRLQGLADMPAGRPAVHLKADDSAHYGQVVAVIAAIQGHGLTDFALVTPPLPVRTR